MFNIEKKEEMLNNEAQVLINLIEKRKSVFPKDYIDQPIDDQILEDLVKYGTMAPNHKRTRPWKYQIFKGEEKVQLGQELQAIYKHNTPDHLFLEKKYNDIGFKTTQAGAIISIVCDFSPLVPEWEDIAAVSMGVQNMYLLCTALGLGCYWSSPKIVEQLKNSLIIEEGQRCLGLFYVGNTELTKSEY